MVSFSEQYRFPVYYACVGWAGNQTLAHLPENWAKADRVKLCSTHMTIEMASRKMTVQTRHLIFWCFLRYLCPLAPHFPHNRQQQKQQPPHMMRKASRRPRATITSTGIIRAANWRGCRTQEPCLQPCAPSYMEELGRERARDRGRGRKRGKTFCKLCAMVILRHDETTGREIVSASP